MGKEPLGAPCSNPGWLFLCFAVDHGKLCGTSESEGIGSPPGWSSPLVQRRPMHMPVRGGTGHCWRREGAQRARGKKHSSSSLVGTNSIRENKETAIKHCFSPCAVVRRQPPTGPPPPTIGKRMRQVQFLHGKYGADVTKQAPLVTYSVCSLPKREC